MQPEWPARSDVLLEELARRTEARKEKEKGGRRGLKRVRNTNDLRIKFRTRSGAKNGSPTSDVAGFGEE